MQGIYDSLDESIESIAAEPNAVEGGMSTRKYENLAGAVQAMASRDLIELAALGLLVQVGAGRGTRYYFRIDGWAPA